VPYAEKVQKFRTDSEQPLHRALQREQARERLAALSPGGSPQRAIPVTSAAVIEIRAAALPCPQCGGLYRLHEHTRPRPDIRRVDVACRQCSTPRALWFRIVDDEPN
jgi:hypothetical protein